MSDPFVKRMMARTQARRAALGLSDNKENTTCHKTDIESPLSTPTVPLVSPEKSKQSFERSSESKITSLCDISSNYSYELPNVTSSSTLSDISTKQRFKSLANGSKQLMEWDDDYSYHSVGSSSSVKDARKFQSILEEDKVLEKDLTPLACDECTNNSHSPYKAVSNVKGSRNVVSNETARPFLPATPHSPVHSKGHSPSSLNLASSSTPLIRRSSPSKTNYAVSPGLCPSPTRTLKWDKSLLSSLEAQGFTPTDSRSKLFYDFEKESNNKSLPDMPKTGSISAKKDTSSSKVQIHKPSSSASKLVLNKVDPVQKPEIEETPSKVSNLRHQWEDHIRRASPERSPIHSPSPVRRQPKSSSSLFTNSPSPSRKFHFGSSTTIGTPHLTNQSSGAIHKSHVSSIKKASSSTKVVKGETPMADVMPVIQNPSSVSVKDRAAAFAAAMGTKETPKVDPSEMTVRDRKSLFEKSKAPALVPKAPFGQNVPLSTITSASKSTGELFGHLQPRHDSKLSVSTPQNNLGISSKASLLADDTYESEYPESEESCEMNELIPDAPPKPPRSFLENNLNAPMGPPSTYTFVSPGSSPRNARTNSRSPTFKFNSTEIDDVVRPSPGKEYIPKIKPGCLFPSLSDIESQSEAIDGQSEEDDDMKNSSFMESVLAASSFESLGKHIQRTAQSVDSSHLSTIKEKISNDQESQQAMLSDTMEVLGAIDDAIEDAIGDGGGPTPPKRTRPKDHDDVRYTPVQKIIRYPDISNQLNDPPVSPSVTIAAKIRKLEEEESRHLNLISQASGAIAVVDQRPEDFGSPQHIEAERLLLISSQKHLAIKDEVERLKMDGSKALGACFDEDADSCRGSISISKITLLLKQEFIDKYMNGDTVHHLFVLVKQRDQVITSEVLTTPECVNKGAITFPNLMVLHDLMSNFSISLEVYSFRVENLSLAQMKKKQSKLRLTPLKRLQRESRISSPSVHSPGGPSSVKTSSFNLVGFAYLNINTLTSNSWTLEKVPYHSPLNGQLSMKVNCSMEGGVTIRSFLTMFDHVSGLGCWNRRWCVLRGPFLRYWRYPDDEHGKDCLGFIDLGRCIDRTVELAPRDLCARPHTFVLRLVCQTLNTDKPIIDQKANRNLPTEALLSADSKEERILWCKKLTKALANTRAWDPNAQRAQDFAV